MTMLTERQEILQCQNRVADQRCITPLETSACSPVRGIAWEARLRHQSARKKMWRLGRRCFVLTSFKCGR